MSVRVPLAVPLLAAAACVVLVTRQAVSDSDFFWHLATGRDVLAGTAGVDHYSWTIAGRPAGLDQWLGEVLFYLAYVAAAWRGIIAVRAIAVAALVVVIVATALAAAPRRPLVALLASVPAIVVSRYAWTDRPELFALVFCAILVALLRSDRPGVPVAVLLLVWSNTHGSYLLGLVLALLVLAYRWLVWPDARRTTLAVAGLSVLACVPTLIRERFVSTSQFWSPPRDISEWSVPDVTTMPALVFGATLIAVLLAAFVTRRRDARELVILVPTAFVSMAATRHLPFFAIVAAPYLARVASEVWERLSRRAPERDAFGRTASAIAGAALALALVGGIATAPSVPDLHFYPAAALGALPEGPGLLNQYDWGGYLIWSSPRTPVFIDGRLVPYAGATLADYRAIIAAHPGWEAVADARGVRAMLVRPTDAIAQRAPERGWRVVYSDATAMVLAR